MSIPACAPRDDVDEIEIRSPCTVSWEEMRQKPGDARTRFCGQCRQNVYNVEAMSRGEARRLIAAREGRACVRILRRPDGTVVTADCWARLRAARRRGILPFLGMILIVGLTEMIAIGVGLARLQSLVGQRTPPEIIEPPPWAVGQMRLVSPRQRPLPVMGDLVAPPRLMGKIHRK